MQIIGLFFILAAVTAQNFVGNRVEPENILSRIFTILSGNEVITELESFRGVYKLHREMVFRQYDSERVFRENVKLGKVQREISATVPFPCDLQYARSKTPPTSVHKLRPGDIDIIAAMGDSVSAGNCLLCTSVIQVLYESRGYAFSGGGSGSWRKFLTLPNILKVFNPKLYGYAVGNALLARSDISRFNVAEPIAMTQDMVFQAKLLINRMRQDPKVDMQNHWKLVTIFIGNVDICCDYCTYENVGIALRKHERELRAALTLLRNSVPRLLINLVAPPNSIETLTRMQITVPCYATHHIFCSCVMNTTTNADFRAAYSAKIDLWHDLDDHVASLPEFETEDFAVVNQPFFANPPVPLLKNGEVDMRAFGGDCFHFSQFGHAIMANSLWNNMMQPVGYKEPILSDPFEFFECPSANKSFIRTNRNSLSSKVQSSF